MKIYLLKTVSNLKAEDYPRNRKLKQIDSISFGRALLKFY